MPSSPRTRRHLSRKHVHFDLDDHLNPFLPPNPIKKLPKPIARFLGYRDEPAKELGNIIISLWALLGAFLGLTVTAAVYKFPHEIAKYHPPVLFASLGATAILDYNTIQSPLAQPRAAIVGHGLSALTGVSIGKLFMLSSNFEDLRWLAGPTACALASFVMSMTNTVHPPGGATAVLAAVDPTTIAMGWMFVPFILLGSCLMFGVACLVNNVQRQFPVFWWTPKEVGSWWRSRKAARDVNDVEASVRSESEVSEKDEKEDEEDEGKEYGGKVDPRSKHMIVLTPDALHVPEGIALERNTRLILETLMEELRDQRDNDHERYSSARHLDSVARMTTGGSHDSDVTHVEVVEQPR